MFPGERVHGVGPSMGGATLLHTACRQPDRFSGLTLMVPPTAWETRAAKSAELLPWVFRGTAASDLPGADQLRTLDLPVSILAWIDDPAHPLSTAHELAQLMPNATLKVARTRSDVLQWPWVLATDVADSPSTTAP